MAADIVINSLEQLAKFMNDKGIFEIALRGEKKKFTQFIKVAIENLPQGEASKQQMANKLFNAMNNANPLMGGFNLAGNGVNTAIGVKSLKMLGEITKLNQFNLILSGVNLCATCVGFAIMFKKLDKMSSKINEVLSAVKTSHKIYVQYEFKKVLSEHSNMLDSRRLQKPYSEEKMRELVDAEYNVLDMLIEAFLENSTGDEETLIFSIYSLASMLAASIMYFDEVYYFTNKENITDGKMWHSSHDTWLSIFDRITATGFVERIQDYGMFELDLNTEENDYYYKNLFEQIIGLKEGIRDNQALITAFGDETNFKKYFEITSQDIRKTVPQLFADVGISMNDDEVAKAVNDAFEKVAVA